MIINHTLFDIIEEQNILKTTKTKPIVDAIKNRVPISFYYSGPRKPSRNSVKAGKRVDAEAVALGLSKKGNLIMRAWVQPPSTSKKGFSKTGWRTFMLSRMGNVEIQDNKTFDSKRPQYKEGDDNSMTVTYVTADWTKTPKIKKVEKPLPISKGKGVKPITTSLPAASGNPTPDISIKNPINKNLPAASGNKNLPQPKPEVKPTSKIQPKIEVPLTEPKKEELPQPKPEEKPKEIPGEENKETLKEDIKRIKSLMLS